MQAEITPNASAVGDSQGKLVGTSSRKLLFRVALGLAVVGAVAVGATLLQPHSDATASDGHLSQALRAAHKSEVAAAIPQAGSVAELIKVQIAADDLAKTTGVTATSCFRCGPCCCILPGVPAPPGSTLADGSDNPDYVCGAPRLPTFIDALTCQNFCPAAKKVQMKMNDAPGVLVQAEFRVKSDAFYTNLHDKNIPMCLPNDSVDLSNSVLSNKGWANPCPFECGSCCCGISTIAEGGGLAPPPATHACNWPRSNGGKGNCDLFTH